MTTKNNLKKLQNIMNLFLFDSSLYVRRKYDNKKSKGYGIRIILNKRKESVIISSLIIIQGRNEKNSSCSCDV